MYDFKTLSPLDFEDLVPDLLQAELDIRLESFGPGRDQGIDCRHAVGKAGLSCRPNISLAPRPTRWSLLRVVKTLR
jgi:hypothetical protein